MFWLPFKSVQGKLRLTTNCSGAVATVALTAVIFGTLLILKYAAPLPGPHKGRVREYFIAAEEHTWDYAPLSRDPMTGAWWNGSIVSTKATRDGAAITPANLYYLDQDLQLAVQSGARRIGTQYRKARYVEYTSEVFTQPKRRPAEEAHLGLMGPLIRAEVGDLIRVHFRNRCSFPASMHPHALFYLREDEGVPMNATPAHHSARGARQFAQHAEHGGGAQGAGLVIPPISAGRGDGSSVQPGVTYTYEWQVPARAGPSDRDASSIAWPYHSHVDETVDPNTGLYGAIVITRTGATRGRDDARPKDVDREVVLSLSLLDENASHLINESMAAVAAGMNATEIAALIADSFWHESNIKHSINGYLYNNVPGLTLNVNETVRWHVLALGDEKDLHGVHWHGATLLRRGRRVDSVELIPGVSQSADMRPDVTGEWMVHCHTSHHFKRGMSAIYTVVNPCATAADPNAPCPPTQ